MDIDELKTRWQAMDRKLDAVLELNLRAVRELKLAPVRTALGRLVWAVVIELLLNGAIAVLLGSYVGERFIAGQVRFALPGLILMSGTIALLHVGARQILAIRSIDYGVPVVAIQRQVEAVRRVELRTVRWVWLLAPLLWTPLLIVGLDVIGIDAYRALGVRYLVANFAFGALFLAVMLWASRAFAERVQRTPWLARLLRDVGGYNLRVARQFLDGLAEFENAR